MKEITVKELTLNPFTKIGDEWCLIASKNKDGFNAMTASWGGFGVIWNKDIAVVYVRPQRYTKSKIDASHTFTISFFNSKYRKILAMYGSKSGKNTNKEELSGFHIINDNEYAYHKEADIVLECKVLYQDSIKPECMLDHSIEEHYPLKDYHDMYIAEIKKVLIKEF